MPCQHAFLIADPAVDEMLTAVCRLCGYTEQRPVWPSFGKRTFGFTTRAQLTVRPVRARGYQD